LLILVIFLSRGRISRRNVTALPVTIRAGKRKKKARRSCRNEMAIVLAWH